MRNSKLESIWNLQNWTSCWHAKSWATEVYRCLLHYIPFRQMVLMAKWLRRIIRKQTHTLIRHSKASLTIVLLWTRTSRPNLKWGLHFKVKGHLTYINV